MDIENISCRVKAAFFELHSQRVAQLHRLRDLRKRGNFLTPTPDNTRFLQEIQDAIEQIEEQEHE